MTILSFKERVARPQDWSQQELATFYRVQNALIQAGLPVCCDRGTTDEGDPWFVFCRSDGEVALHFARINGCYIIAGPIFQSAVVNRNLDELVQEVIQRHATTGRHLGNNVYLHPAALLVTLVAIAVFNCSETNARSDSEDRFSRGRIDVGGASPHAFGGSPGNFAGVFGNRDVAEAALIKSAIFLLSGSMLDRSIQAQPHHSDVGIREYSSPAADENHALHHNPIFEAPDGENALTAHEIYLTNMRQAPIGVSHTVQSSTTINLSVVEQIDDVFNYTTNKPIFFEPADSQVSTLKAFAVDPLEIIESASSINPPYEPTPFNNAGTRPQNSELVQQKMGPQNSELVQQKMETTSEAAKFLVNDLGADQSGAHLDSKLKLSNTLIDHLETGPHLPGTESSAPLGNTAEPDSASNETSSSVSEPAVGHSLILDDAVHSFIYHVPDFKVVISGMNINLVDALAIQYAEQQVVHVVFEFSDGSHLSLIGMPGSLPEGLI